MIQDIAVYIFWEIRVDRGRKKQICPCRIDISEKST